jgi:hypothetical protein
MPTLRFTMDLTAALSFYSKSEPIRINYQVTNFDERLGWQEIIAKATPGVVLQESNVPQSDLSNALQNYPEGRLFSPLNFQNADIVAFLQPAGSVRPAEAAESEGVKATARQDDRFARLIKTKQLTPAIIAVAVSMAFALGAFHALSPGHGKSIVAAYLVGSHGTPKHALSLMMRIRVIMRMTAFIITTMRTVPTYTGITTRDIPASKIIDRMPWISYRMGIIITSGDTQSSATWCRWRPCDIENPAGVGYIGWDSPMPFGAGRFALSDLDAPYRVRYDPYCGL